MGLQQLKRPPLTLLQKALRQPVLKKILMTRLSRLKEVLEKRVSLRKPSASTATLMLWSRLMMTQCMSSRVSNHYMRNQSKQLHVFFCCRCQFSLCCHCYQTLNTGGSQTRALQRATQGKYLRTGRVCPTTSMPPSHGQTEEYFSSR